MEVFLGSQRAVVQSCAATTSVLASKLTRKPKIESKDACLIFSSRQVYTISWRDKESGTHRQRLMKGVR